MKNCNIISYKRKGMSLIEVLVAGSVMALFVSMVGFTLVAAYRTHAKNSQHISYTRKGMIGISYLGRELKMSKEIYSPPLSIWVEGGSYAPIKGVTPPLVFKRYNAGTEQDIQVAYQLNPDTKELERFLYDSDYETIIEGSRKTVATAVQQFQVERLPSKYEQYVNLKIDLVLALEGTTIPFMLEEYGIPIPTATSTPEPK